MKGKGKYYWKFKALIPEILSEQKECMICGSKNNLNIHHMLHCDSYDQRYCDKHNLIVLCRTCHNDYHKKYSRVTPVTLLEYIRNKSFQYKENVDYLKKEIRDYQDLINWILQMK